VLLSKHHRILNLFTPMPNAVELLVAVDAARAEGTCRGSNEGRSVVGSADVSLLSKLGNGNDSKIVRVVKTLPYDVPTRRIASLGQIRRYAFDGSVYLTARRHK